MAGIKASSASKVMADGDVAVTDVEIGYITGEQIALATLPSGSSYAWVVAKPSSSTVRASLSLATSATPTFTPDVAGEYVFVCVVDGVTSYVLRTSVTAVAQTTALESIRYQPLTDVRVPTPPSGGAVYYSSDLNALAIKTPDDSVNQIGGADHYRTFKNKTASAIASSLIAGTAGAIRRYRITGTLVIDQILTLPSFVDIDATGANITTTLAPAVGLADDWTNTLFKAASVSTATTTRVIADAGSTAAFPGATRLAVTSSVGFAAGDWILVFSYNRLVRPPSYITGEDAPVYRIYKVASVAAGIINIVGVVSYWHANWVSDIDLITPLPPEGSTVTKITLTEGITWRGGRFDCSGGSIANAFHFDGVLNVKVSGVTFKGFSRAGIEFLRGSKNIELSEIAHEGEVNCAIYLQQSEQVTIDNFRSPTVASATRHANGIPRALITMRRRTSKVIINNGHFAWGTIGIQHWHVEGVIGNNLVFENLDGNNRPETIDGQISKRCGIAIDGGQASTALIYPNGVDGIGAQDGAPFSVDVNFTNVLIYKCLGDAATQCFIYLHDSIAHRMTDVTIANYGNGDGTGGLAIKPIILSDAPGAYLKNLHTTGTYGCIYTENLAALNGRIDGVHHQAAAGSGYSFGYFLDLNHGYSGGQLIIRNVKITNGSFLWTFGTQFGDYAMQIENFQNDPMTQPSDLLICVSNTTVRPANEFQVMQITGALGASAPFTNFVMVGAAASGAQAKCVASVSGNAIYFESGLNGGFGFVQVVQPGKRSTVRCANTVGTGPAITQGDLMRHSAAGDGGLTVARGDNAVTFDKALGKVFGIVPTVGAVGLVKLV